MRHCFWRVTTPPPMRYPCGWAERIAQDARGVRMRALASVAVWERRALPAQIEIAWLERLARRSA